MYQKGFLHTFFAFFVAATTFVGGFFLSHHASIAPTQITPAPQPSVTISPTAPTNQKITTGITGTITLGPITPVCKIGTPCDKPYQGTVIVKTMDGKEITQFTSSGDGLFTVALQPGTYWLTSVNTMARPHMQPQQVVVNNGQLTTLHIQFDTGIR